MQQNSPDAELDVWHMRRALELATQGLGHVEPNPLVGCVIAQGAEVIGEGWHRRYGGPHAEVEALAMAGQRAAGATAYVTLEPCAHHGKTPPCVEALLRAGVARVVAAVGDPFPQVDGRGLQQLAAAGVEVSQGVLESEARRLNAPYFKLLGTGQPWVIAKWAMTLDGKLATRTGHSQWISSAASRAVVHRLRGRVDAIVVGQGTAAADDPQLTARPPGERTALRVVLSSQANLAPQSQLVRTAREVPVLVATSAAARVEQLELLAAQGCEVHVCPGTTYAERWLSLLAELGRRRLTNLLVEGGARLLGVLFDTQSIDEAHVFIAPRLVGGDAALSPIGGQGMGQIDAALEFDDPQVEQLEGDVYFRGRIRRSAR